MATCPVCEKRKGKRKCTVYVGERICPVCCARDRSSPACDRCRYFKQASAYAREKRNRNLVRSVSHIKGLCPAVYELIESRCQEVSPRVPEVFTEERIERGSLSVDDTLNDGGKFVEIVYGFFADIITDDAFDDVRFSEQAVLEIMEAMDLDYEPLLEGEDASGLIVTDSIFSPDGRDPREILKRYHPVLQEVLARREERERLAVSLLNTAAEGSGEYRDREYFFFLVELDQLLKNDIVDLEWHPLYMGALMNTCMKIARREYLSGGRSRSRIILDRARERSMKRSDSGRLFIPGRD